jgi:hypothetical protein
MPVMSSSLNMYSNSGGARRVPSVDAAVFPSGLLRTEKSNESMMLIFVL